MMLDFPLEGDKESKFEPLTYDDGDVVLRAGDADFRVHSFILRLASPFFRTLFQLPQPPSSTPEEKVITMTESKEVVDKLLRWIYPVRTKPSVSSIDEAKQLSAAADKLEIECATQPLLESLTVLLAAEPNPLRAWALAVQFKHAAAKRAAALRFIRTPPHTAPAPIAELAPISALEYAELLLCRQAAHARARAATAYELGSWWGCKKCCKAASQHSQYVLSSSFGSGVGGGGGGGGGGVSDAGSTPTNAQMSSSASMIREATVVPEWFQTYRDRIADRNPLVDDVSSDGLFDACVASSSCVTCRAWYEGLGVSYRPAAYVRKKLELVEQWTLRECNLLSS
jgi:hypothetical protein